VARARFLLRPRWLLSHLLVALLAVIMITLGFWQLRRLDEKRDRNALVEARMDEPTVPVEELLAPGDGDAAVDGIRFREVTASGTYDVDATVVVRNRSQDGAPGAWLVTPLTLSTGDRVAVIRGFTGFAADGSVPQPDPASGSVTVTGIVVDPGRLGGTAERDLSALRAADDLLPGFVQAQSSDPEEPAIASAASGAPDGPELLALPAPELSEGPHLGYALQWFTFATIALVGYPIILRRLVIRRGKEADDAEGGDGDAGGDDLDREIEGLLRGGT
jgi:cytochrome oxidase assembly protein ShyY1